MAQHIKPPYTASNEGVFKGGKCIALCDTDVVGETQNTATAAFIVRACNAHDELLTVLKIILENADRVEHDCWSLLGHENFNPDDIIPFARKLIEKIEAQL